MSGSSWEYATDMVRRFLAKPARLQHLMERLPVEEDGGKRRACQALLYGTVRHLSLLEAALGTFLKKKPKPKLYSPLLVASYEILSDPSKSALVVDHAVGRIKKQCSKVEAGLANAVLRKVVHRLEEMRGESTTDSAGLALRFSHPQWMVERWVNQFGDTAIEKFLAWNQLEPDLIVLALGDSQAIELSERGFERLNGRYFKSPGSGWSTVQSALDARLCYVQNAGAGGAVSLVAGAISNGRILDLCAAPGGKSIALASQLGDDSEIVAVDLPGSRLNRLQENFESFSTTKVSIVGKDIFDLSSSEIGQFDCVLLDAPCSNSGVLQRKVDAKWRLSPRQFKEILDLQKRMLSAAAKFVKPGGYLVYSTCSIDGQENQETIDWFLGTWPNENFVLAKSAISLPWETGYDGAGAFLLHRSDSE